MRLCLFLLLALPMVSEGQVTIQEYPIPRGLYALLGVYGPSAGGHGDYQVIIAAMVIATIPLIILFFVGQKYFIEQGGIATQGRKG